MIDTLTAAVLAERERRGLPTEGTKRCNACGDVKPVSEFSPDRRRLNGRGRISQCKTCTAARVRRVRATADPDARDRERRRKAAHNAALRALARHHPGEFQRLYALALAERGLAPGGVS